MEDAGEETGLRFDIEYVWFRQQLGLRVHRHRLGIELTQDEANELLRDERQVQAAYDAWRRRSEPGRTVH